MIWLVPMLVAVASFLFEKSLFRAIGVGILVLAIFMMFSEVGKFATDDAFSRGLEACKK